MLFWNRAKERIALNHSFLKNKVVNCAQPLLDVLDGMHGPLYDAQSNLPTLLYKCTVIECTSTWFTFTFISVSSCHRLIQIQKSTHPTIAFVHQQDLLFTFQRNVPGGAGSSPHHLIHASRNKQTTHLSANRQGYV